MTATRTRLQHELNLKVLRYKSCLLIWQIWCSTQPSQPKVGFCADGGPVKQHP
jgi:hypothetical protein